MNAQLTIWESENPLVKVHNPIVFSQLATMDVTAMRLFLLMLAKWNVDAPSEDVIKIQFKELIPKYSGNNGAEYKTICSAINDLKESIRDIKVEEMSSQGVRTYKIMSVLDYLEFSSDKQYIEGRFAMKIRDYLRTIKGRFTLAELKEIFKLRSYHSIRLYLIGKSFFDGMPNVKLSLDEFKQIVVGNADSYKEYKVLKRDVINTSIKALQGTSAAVCIDEKKEGRNVVGLVIRPANPIKGRELEGEIPSPFSEEIKKLFGLHSVNTAKAAEMLMKGEIPEKYITYVFDKFKDANDSKKGAWIHAAIVKKKFLNEYQLTIPAAPVYKPLPKPTPMSYLKFESFEAIAQYKNPESYRTMLLEAGYFETEKGGKAGLGIWE